MTPKVDIERRNEDSLPILSYNDIRVYIGFWSDKTPYIQIETSPESDSWQDLDVYMNDGKAVRWE